MEVIQIISGGYDLLTVTNLYLTCQSGKCLSCIKVSEKLRNTRNEFTIHHN